MSTKSWTWRNWSHKASAKTGSGVFFCGFQTLSYIKGWGWTSTKKESKTMVDFKESGKVEKLRIWYFSKNWRKGYRFIKDFLSRPFSGWSRGIWWFTNHLPVTIYKFEIRSVGGEVDQFGAWPRKQGNTMTFQSNHFGRFPGSGNLLPWQSIVLVAHIGNLCCIKMLRLKTLENCEACSG